MPFDPAAEFAKLDELKRAAKAAQSLADGLKKEAKQFEAELWERASEAGTYGHRGREIRGDLKQTDYGTITDYDLFKKWVYDQNLDEELLKTQEESARLNELVRARLETGEELPPGVGWYTRKYISITRNKEEG